MRASRAGIALVVSVFMGFALVAASDASAAPSPSPLLAAPSEIERLVDEMGGADQAKRHPAYIALLAKRDAAAIAPVAARIGTWDLSAQSWGVSLLQMLPPEDTAAAWKKLLSSDASFVRACAALQTRASDGARSTKVLVEVIGAIRSDPGAASMVFARMSGTRDPAVQSAVRDLLTPDCDETVLGSALGYLQAVEDVTAVAAVRGVAKTEAKEGNGGRRSLAVAWLLRFGEEDTAQILADEMRAGHVPYATFSRMKPWLDAADRIPDSVLDGITANAAVEEDIFYVGLLVAVLGKARYAPALSVVRTLMESEDAIVSKAAFEALSLIPGGIDVDGLRGQLGSKDLTRRLSAADALRRVDDFSGLPAVLELAAKGSAERGEAVRLLGLFRSESCVTPLIDALEDDSLAVRANAYNALSPVLTAVCPYRRIDLASVGYTTNADAASRAAGVAKIRAWWDAARKKSY